jgi:Fe-S-cluster containining protein
MAVTLPQKVNFENKELCSKCGGKCCKGMPGICQPEDFGQPLTEKIAEALVTQKYAIDWWYGDPRDGKDELDRTYYIRPATKNSQKMFDPSWGGECIFLTGAGCTLSHDDRPHSCRMLEPKKDEACEYHGVGKRKEVVQWIPYQKNILDASIIAERRLNPSDRRLY